MFLCEGETALFFNFNFEMFEAWVQNFEDSFFAWQQMGLTWDFISLIKKLVQQKHS